MKSQSLKGLKVLDSSALLSYFEGEKGAAVIKEILHQADAKDEPLLMSMTHWGEVLYTIERRYGEEKTREIERCIDQMPIEIIPPNSALVRLAAHLKAVSKLPYSDAFAAALAIERKAQLITCDKDFQTVEDKIPIVWI